MALHEAGEGVQVARAAVSADRLPAGLRGAGRGHGGIDVGIGALRDAREYLAVGATLVQGYTGFVYGGPLWAARIGRALARDAVAREQVA